MTISSHTNWRTASIGLAMAFCGTLSLGCDRTSSSSGDDDAQTDAESVDAQGAEPEEREGEDAGALDAADDLDAAAADAESSTDTSVGGDLDAALEHDSSETGQADAGPHALCGRVIVVGLEDHSGTIVDADGRVVTTDSDGRYCLPSESPLSGLLTVTRDGHQQLVAGYRAGETDGGVGVQLCDYKSFPSAFDPRISELRCEYLDARELTLPRATRVHSGETSEVFPGGPDAFLYTHDLKPGPSWLFAPPGTIELSRGFFDGRPHEHVGRLEAHLFARPQLPAYFWAPTLSGNMLFFRTSEGPYSAVVAAGGGPIALSGWCQAVAPDGKSAVLSPASPGGLALIELARAPNQEGFTQHPLTDTPMWARDPNDLRGVREQRLVQLGADGWVYFWDGTTPPTEPWHVGLLRARVGGGPAERLAEDTFPGLLALSPDKRWMAWVSYADMNLMLARSDGSDARVVGPYAAQNLEIPLRFSTHSNAATLDGRTIPLGMPPDPHFESATQRWPVASGFVYSAPASTLGPAGTYFLSGDGQTRNYLGADPVREAWDFWVALAAGSDPAARTLTFMRADGSEARALPGPVADDDWIALRGNHVLTRPRAGTSAFRLLNLSDGSLLQASYVTEWDPSDPISAPDFSPDGSAVVFVTGSPDAPSDNPVLHVVELATLRERFTLPGVRGIQFSPDGSRVVFRAKYRAGSALATLDAAGKVQVYTEGKVIAWLSNRRLLITHRTGTSYERGFHALELPY